MELTTWAIFSLLIFSQYFGVKGSGSFHQTLFKKRKKWSFIIAGAGPSLKDPQNGFKYGRLNQNFTIIADVGDNYLKNTCQWFVPNPVQNGASIITLNMGELKI